MHSKLRKFNAKEIIDKYGSANIMGEVSINEIHLSSKLEYETKNGSRMKKELYSNILKQDQNPEEAAPYFACEAKITLSIDDLFDWFH